MQLRSRGDDVCAQQAVPLPALAAAAVYTQHGARENLPRTVTGGCIGTAAKVPCMHMHLSVAHVIYIHAIHGIDHMRGTPQRTLLTADTASGM